jgi:5-methyltetrahydrofolate--homocysteine methyltransferase
MASLLYREDWEEARARLSRWWNGGDIGRAAMLVYAPRLHPVEDVPAMPQPEGWVTHYSTKSLEYRVNVALRTPAWHHYLGEAVPAPASGDLAPNCLALFLGCAGVEMPGTVWCRPCIEDPEAARFEYNPHDYYWTFCKEVYRRVGEQSSGKFLQQFPDLIEGLDTLAAMRGSEKLLQDLIDRPEWVHASLRRITDLYFRYYDVLYDMLRDEVGGSVFWAWAPGRTAKFQCDFSAMISPSMFREFMWPVLAEMTERVSYSMYHWDGPGAICHHDALLELPHLDMLQWTPGAGVEESWHRRWWPLYHKTLDAGKKVFISGGGRDELLALKREFGAKSKGMLISTNASSVQEGEELVRMMEVD